MDTRTLISWPEYRAIRLYYGDRKAERSQVPLMHHIREGLAVMYSLSASTIAMRAYCLHPLVQNDKELQGVGWNYLSNTDNSHLDLLVVAFAMEYRARANAWLSDKVNMFDGQLIVQGHPDPGPLEAVRYMLIADKVQNYKDFMLHHYGKHARSVELYHYFKRWFAALQIENQVDDLIRHIEKECPYVS